CRSSSKVAPPVPGAPPTAEAKEGAEVAAASGVPVLRLALDHPRLAEARGLARANDHAGAVAALRRSRPAELGPSERCAWDYTEGRLALAAEAFAEAATAFARAEAPACAFSGYARLRGAQAHARAGNLDEAAQRARAVPDDLALRDDATFLLADALAAK